MAERKKGSRKDSFNARTESKQLGPYPPWEAWRNTLLNHLDGELPKGVETHLHEWYFVRREGQLGVRSPEEQQVLERQFSDEHSDLFEDDSVVKAFRFITEKTSKQS